MSSTIAPPLPPALPFEPIMRISVEQYHLMIASGVFADDQPVELLEGWLVPKMPKKPSHRIATTLLSDELKAILPAGWHLVNQDPITTAESEPEPDVMVVRGKVRDYADRHPGPADLGLIVEVSDTTVARDRGVKKRIFGRASIPIYWIVNLVDHQIEVYTDPTGPDEQPDYRQKHIFGPSDRIPVVLDGKEIGQIEVKAILP